MRSILTQCLSIAGLAAIFGLPTAPAEAMSFTYTTFDIDGTNYVQPTGINDKGLVVGHFQTTNGYTEGFFNKAGVISFITTANPQNPITTVGISLNGTALGYSTDLSTGTPYPFYATTTSQFTAPGTNFTPRAMGDLGQAVGSYEPPGYPPLGFLIAADRTTQMPVYINSSEPTYLTGVNRASSVVGYFDSADGNTHGLQGSAVNPTQFDYPNAVLTLGTAISDKYVFGIYVDKAGRTHGLRLANGVFRRIDAATPGNTYVVAANHLGAATGYYTDYGNPISSNFRGYYYSSSGAITLIDVPGATDTRPSALNSVGQITGYATIGGKAIGFIATCVKSPGTNHCAP